MKEQIKSLLGLNLPNTTVAQAVGVDDSYVAQLMGDEVFASEVHELRVKNLAANAERDGKYNKIEDTLLAKLEEILENPLFLVKNPAILLHAIRTINSAKRRAAPQEMAGVGQRTVVPLVLPTVIANTFIVNQKNQVVEVGGRSISTMPANNVLKELEVLRTNRENNSAQEKIDVERAEERLKNLAKEPSVPVRNLLTLAEQL